MEKVLFATDEQTGLMHIFFLTFIAEWIISGDVANPILPVYQRRCCQPYTARMACHSRYRTAHIPMLCSNYENHLADSR